ncbi:MotE family protein [Oceanobacillus salinisoli]|uniref:MotE family protein n=1 Tax=Oceanobacillus salinisoli TaxID=2678611 RepID=UPI0012E19DF1|nr:hypothetical protein [Oceanobacillus salinisoli]
MAEKKKNENKKMNPFLWFLFAVVIPVIIVITLVIIILNIAGIDVINWAKEKGDNIPVVSNLVTTEEEAEIKSRENHFEQTIEDKDEEIEQLNQNISDLEMVISDLEQEMVRLERAQSEQDALEEANIEGQMNEAVKTVAKSYEEMDRVQAAVILENMEDRTSIVTILKEVPNDIRGEILQEMDPEIAADITQRLMSSSN